MIAGALHACRDFKRQSRKEIKIKSHLLTLPFLSCGNIIPASFPYRADITVYISGRDVVFLYMTLILKSSAAVPGLHMEDGFSAGKWEMGNRTVNKKDCELLTLPE